MSKRRDPGWRDRAAADLLVRHLPALDLEGSVLLMGERFQDVADAFQQAGSTVTSWNRRAFGGRGATPWPPPGPFDSAALRIPRGREELVMSLHAAHSVLVEGGRLFLYGAKDEGVESAHRGQPLFSDPETVGVGGRCRVLSATRQPQVGTLRGSLTAWKSHFRPDFPGFPEEWTSYPGIFAHGHLDPGTRLLLGALPTLPSGARVLDYGCGSGLVGWLAARSNKDTEVHLLDVDSVALAAAEENVPEGRIILGDGLPSEMGRPFDAILSNPPFHVGKGEDPGLITRLIAGAPGVLSRRGSLVLVAQQRLPLGRTLRGTFGVVTLLAEGDGYRVWEGRKP